MPIQPYAGQITNKTFGQYFTKHHPLAHHRLMHPLYLYMAQKSNTHWLANWRWIKLAESNSDR